MLQQNEAREADSQSIPQPVPVRNGQAPWGNEQEMVIPLRERVPRRTNDVQESVAPVETQGTGARNAADTLTELHLLNDLLTGMVHAKNQFVTAMGLRLRSPLTTLVGYTEMLVAGEVQEPDDLQMVYDDLLAAGRQLLDLVNDMIEFARADAGDLRLRRTAVPLADVLREAMYHLEPLAGSRRQQIIVEAPPALPLAWADRRWMTLVAIKLGTNALRFSPTGSTVKLCARAVDDEYVAIDVVDEGVGIRPEEGETIFQPFHEPPRATREMTGTGLELPLVKRLVQLQDGMITYTSARGIGTTFTVMTPRARDPSALTAHPVSGRERATRLTPSQSDMET